MNVHIVKPYSIEKNLGQAYNEVMRLIPDGDWACLMDYDTMFLTPDCGEILHNYARFSPFVGMFTCYTNRIHPLSPDQLYGGKVSENPDVSYHIKIAEEIKKDLYDVTRIEKPVSGFLMMIKKTTWNDIRFTEDMKCLGVDNDYCYKLKDNGLSVYRMDGLYIWHTYRMKNGIQDKTHLK